MFRVAPPDHRQCRQQYQGISQLASPENKNASNPDAAILVHPGFVWVDF